MTCAVVCIGTEITRGELVNTNAAHLSSSLTDLGFEVCEEISIPDDVGTIVGTLERLSSRVAVIVCTGGLGPTTDDLTTEAAARTLGVRLVRDEGSLEAIRRRFEKLGRTIAAVEEKLWVDTPIGGIARYENDYYHQVSLDVKRIPGNPWFVSTLWLAEWHARRAKTPEDLARAREYLAWAEVHARPSGVMAEQVHPETGEPLSVAPLTWSHAAYVAAATAISRAASRLSV